MWCFFVLFCGILLYISKEVFCKKNNLVYFVMKSNNLQSTDFVGISTQRDHLEFVLLILMGTLSVLFVLLFFFTTHKVLIIIAGIFFVGLTGIGLFVIVVAKMWQHEVHSILKQTGQLHKKTPAT